MAEPHDESESSLGPDKTEPEANQAEQVDAEAAEAELVAEGQVPDAIAAAPKKKKKKRAQLDEQEPSRDRNRRLREEMVGGRRTKPGAIPARNLEAGEIVDDALARPELGSTRERFIFRLDYRARSVTVVLREGYVGDEFIALARTENRSEQEENRLTVLKGEMAKLLLATPAADVYDVDDAG